MNIRPKVTKTTATTVRTVYKLGRNEILDLLGLHRATQEDAEVKVHIPGGGSLAPDTGATAVTVTVVEVTEEESE